jgi:hypothetical protein
MLTRLAVPAVRPLKDVWLDKFSYKQLTVEEVDLVEEHIVSPDPETCILMRKPLGKQAQVEGVCMKATRDSILQELCREDNRTSAELFSGQVRFRGLQYI